MGARDASGVVVPAPLAGDAVLSATARPSVWRRAVSAGGVFLLLGLVVFIGIVLMWMR
jgi:hypothetical protein